MTEQELFENIRKTKKQLDKINKIFNTFKDHQAINEVKEKDLYEKLIAEVFEMNNLINQLKITDSLESSFSDFIENANHFIDSAIDILKRIPMEHTEDIKTINVMRQNFIETLHIMKPIIQIKIKERKIIAKFIKIKENYNELCSAYTHCTYEVTNPLAIKDIKGYKELEKVMSENEKLIESAACNAINDNIENLINLAESFIKETNSRSNKIEKNDPDCLLRIKALSSEFTDLFNLIKEFKEINPQPQMQPQSQQQTPQIPIPDSGWPQRKVLLGGLLVTTGLFFCFLYKRVSIESFNIFNKPIFKV